MKEPTREKRRVVDVAAVAGVNHVTVPGQMNASGLPTVAWNAVAQLLGQVDHPRRVPRVDDAEVVAAVEQESVRFTVADFVSVQVVISADELLESYERTLKGAPLEGRRLTGTPDRSHQQDRAGRPFQGFVGRPSQGQAATSAYGSLVLDSHGRPPEY